MDDSPKKRKAEPNVTLSGIVQDANTQLNIKNAIVVLQTSFGDLETTTDDLGNFELELSLPQPETVLIMVDAANYLRYSKPVALKLNDSERLVVEMGGRVRVNILNFKVQIFQYQHTCTELYRSI